MKSKRLYKKHKYYTRKKVSSYKSKKSNHILNARKIYNITNISPNKELSFKTGCKLSALNQIVKKGEGAYYSSGSRPNQTAQSWGLARLASSLTSGKSAVVDYDIIKKGCNHKKKAFILANKSKKNINTVIPKQKNGIYNFQINIMNSKIYLLYCYNLYFRLHFIFTIIALFVNRNKSPYKDGILYFFLISFLLTALFDKSIDG